MKQQDSTGTITRAVNSLGRGDRHCEDVYPTIYGQLRHIARRKLAGERRDCDLQTTVMVNEAVVRLMNQEHVTWENRAHYFGAAAEAMRRILVDAARKRKVRERYLRLTRPKAAGADGGGDGPDQPDLLALDEALKALEHQDPVLGKVVKLRYFAGLSVADTASMMDLSERSVKRNWAIARAWLFRRMKECDPAEPTE